MMDSEDEKQMYADTLENALYLLCEAMGVEPEYYDTDKADFECYMDCFRDASKIIKKAGCKFDYDLGEFVLTKQKAEVVR